jgi:hypothetical protein
VAHVLVSRRGSPLCSGTKRSPARCWANRTQDDCYAIERLFRDAAAVGISAAMLGLEIGTKLLRPNFISGLRQDPVAPHPQDLLLLVVGP